MNLSWQTTPEASCWHTLLAAASGAPLQHPELAAAAQCGPALLAEAADAWFDAAVLPASPEVSAALERCRARLMPAGEEAFADGLRLRGGPIREQWEARGPGLMRQLGRLTDPAPPAPATVHLVEPVVGGHGIALPAVRAVTLEAVLANPVAELPEVVRLGWLLAQLDALTPHGPLALAPAVLAAAEEVELARLDEPTLEQMLTALRLSDNPISTTAMLLAWWRDYRASLAPWPVAVSHLTARLS